MAVGDGVVWNESDPQNSTLAHLIDDYDRDLRVGVRSRMAREHVWPAAQTGTGEGGHHSFITFQQQTAAPTLLASSGMVGCIYVGSSGAGYPLVFENSAGSTVTLVNSAFNIPIIASGTLGAMPICSSANPDRLILLSGPTSTTAKTWILSSINDATGGTAAPTWVLPSTALSGPSVISATNVTALYGAIVDKSASYGNQQATTDGIVEVMAYTTAGGDVEALGYTDSSATPTTCVMGGDSRDSGWAHPGRVGFGFSVKKGDYWRVEVTFQLGGGSISVRWRPIGS